MNPKSDVFRALGNAVRALRARVDRTLQHSGLRLGQYQVLRHLWEEDGLTPREIADRLGVEMPTVTRTVQRMVRDGLVAPPSASRRRPLGAHLPHASAALTCAPPLPKLSASRPSMHCAASRLEERAEFADMLDRIAENCKDERFGESCHTGVTPRVK